MPSLALVGRVNNTSKDLLQCALGGQAISNSMQMDTISLFLELRAMNSVPNRKNVLSLYMYSCIYIYIERERERGLWHVSVRDSDLLL